LKPFETEDGWECQILFTAARFLLFGAFPLVNFFVGSFLRQNTATNHPDEWDGNLVEGKLYNFQNQTIHQNLKKKKQTTT